MGLDMYLNRMPRFGDTTPREVEGIESYFSWKKKKAEGNKYAKCTLKKWCGIAYNELSKKAIKFYEPFYTIRYSEWDSEHKYGYGSITEEVGYWRKANAIHRWFVDVVQHGEDDCKLYEVSKEQLEELLKKCKLIKENVRMVKGKIINGYKYDDDLSKMVPIYEEGEYIENPEICEKYLPSQSGFFFGGTDYDQWYMQDITYTIEALTKVLEETDFKTQMVSYRASW